MKSDYYGYNNEDKLPDWICDYKLTTYYNMIGLCLASFDKVYDSKILNPDIECIMSDMEMSYKW